MRTSATHTAQGRYARLRLLAAAVTAGAISLTTLTACGSSDDSSSSSSSSPSSTASTPAKAAAPVTVQDPWAKAADSGMTAVFGTLVNTTDSKVTVVSATSTVSKKTELHEVADVEGKPVMRPKKGGFVIPAQGNHQLQPGADHLMLMGLDKAVKPGDEVTVTLTLKDGKTVRFTAVAKAFAGGKENYSSGMDSDMKMKKD
ncbi:copper chaperone PCu(A)C [Streptomyces sp. RY43-2]|uniref:Copper chaperone PCu(A)C n=1 Tax=Streptomyces macrolidinus TaxID=2952607 RepID=A0ABT0ZJV6_9ACTN|nr:copper chaperone PCu(A)C [Streptomyces macrolidinus]MCN9243810.1 copper chaperone PCu(A)C [Streptomyces macrolidinus]